MRTFTVVLIVMGVLSIAQMWPSPSRQWAGVVTEVEPGKWIWIANEMSDPRGFRMALNSRTRVEGDPRDLRRGARVRAFYAGGGGEYVARRLTILPDAPPRPLRKTDKDLRQ